MKKIWEKLLQGLEKIASENEEFNFTLNAGASNNDFIKLEELIHAKLPEDFKAFYAIHNGEEEYGQGVMEGEEFLSINRIINEWNIWKGLLDDGDFEDSKSTPEKGIKNDWWNALWIPFTYDGSGNHICIDLDPDVDGKRGQVIRMWHDMDERELLANSFEEWVNNYADKLYNGEYVYSEDYGMLMDKEMLEE